jgi:hypothetical protein
MHVAPACAGFDHFRSYVRSLSLHFCKRLFLGLTHDLMVTRQQLHRCAKAPLQNTGKGSPVHVAPTCARYREGSDHFGLMYAVFFAFLQEVASRT